MNNTSLYSFIESELSWILDDHYDINVVDIAEDLTNGLEANGYCKSPYVEYEKALMCPINKRLEAYCNCTICPSHEFCLMLRKEGYI